MRYSQNKVRTAQSNGCPNLHRFAKRACRTDAIAGPAMNDRLWLLALGFAALGAVFTARLFYLQAMRGSYYAALVDQAKLVVEVLPPRRGRIVDRHHVPLADSCATYDLSVVFSDLELSGRARRELPCYRINEQGFDALIADLSGRLRWIGQAENLRAVVTRELLAHPAVAVRTGRRTHAADVGLVATAKATLAPVASALDGEDTAELAESELFSEDPRDALEREILVRWDSATLVVTENEFTAACAQLDRDFGLTQAVDNERTLGALDPFVPPYRLTVPTDTVGATTTLDLRLIAPERRAQAEGALARILGEAEDVVHERLGRALATARDAAGKQAHATSTLYFGPSAQAEAIAGRLPPGGRLMDVPVKDLPGARERIFILQGDPPDGEGLLTQMCRRLAATLGSAGDVMQGLIEKHAQRMRVAACERDYRVHQIVLDPARYERLANGLAAALTALGRPTSRLDLDQALATARRAADKEWTGQTRHDALVLIRDLPHRLAVRMAGANREPPRDLLALYDDAASTLPGLVVQPDVGRTYPFPGSASHLIGLVGRDDDAFRGGLKGQGGLEGSYDTLLRGQPGARLRVRTPDGVRVLRDDPALAGADLVTELDMELQTIAEDSLTHFYELAQELGTATERMDRSRRIGKGRAGFVLMDCHTGALLACATAPGYRIEDYRAKFAELNADPTQPLHDFATEPVMPPGSSFKILTALAGLEYGVLKPGEFITSPGYMTKIGGKPVLRDHAPPGTYDLVHAIMVSSNVYFAKIAERIGGERLATYTDLFQLGGKNALDVANQKAVHIPRPSSIGVDRPAEPHWYPSDTWRLGIGQNSVNSPLQVVTIAAAVANGGHVVRPYLVAPQGDPPQVVDLNIRAEYLDQVRRGMEQVTSPEGTARLLVLAGAAGGIKVAAKTGTSEFGSERTRALGLTEDNAWMIGYAPAEAPTVAFACFVHSGTFGGQACTPIAKRVLEVYFTKYGRGGHAAAAP